MRDRRLRLALEVGVLAVLAVSLLGGGVQAQQAAPAALKGRVVTETISAPSLVGNLIADKAEKTISVYLPPSYDSAQARYPVVYFLPGYGGGWYPFEDQMNRLIASGGVKEMIVVTVPGQHRFGGSFYVNSPVTGNWEDLIVVDIVGYVDAHYRTLPQSASRGIGGHSMGGYGALNLAMLHPDVFGAVYSLSPGLFDPNGLAESQMFSYEGAIKAFLALQDRLAPLSREDAARQFETEAGRTSADLNFTIAYGEAFAADPSKNAPYVDYPYRYEGTSLVRDAEVWAHWEEGFGGIAVETERYRANLLSLAAIGLDYAPNDNYAWIPKGCEYYVATLTAAGIPIEVNTHRGGHQGLLRQRLEQFLLPFFSRVLSFE